MSDALIETDSNLVQIDTEQVEAVLEAAKVEENEVSTTPTISSTDEVPSVPVEASPVGATSSTEARKKPAIFSIHRPLSKSVLIMIWLLFTLSISGTLVSAVAAFNYGMGAYTAYT